MIEKYGIGTDFSIELKKDINAISRIRVKYGWLLPCDSTYWDYDGYLFFRWQSSGGMDGI
jgi:hypothetical protein